jgi:hypothetical protein
LVIAGLLDGDRELGPACGIHADNVGGAQAVAEPLGDKTADLGAGLRSEHFF